MDGWMFWRGDEINSFTGFDLTKDGLLIGYDMIPLRGLEACEAFMNNKGWQALPTRVVVCEDGEPFHCYAATVKGQVDLPMIEWSICGTDKADTLKGIAGYIGCMVEPPVRRPEFALDFVDPRLFKRFWIYWEHDLGDPTLPRDKRRVTAYQRERQAVLEILAKLQIEIVPIRYEKVE